jgi:hypothetical protein
MTLHNRIDHFPANNPQFSIGALIFPEPRLKIKNGSMVLENHWSRVRTQNQFFDLLGPPVEGPYT